ncbi:hypothetical protein QYZ45_28145 [Vibrio parahaemolyticus]|nr:hypothetical protein [Vibrio parahaemolyticus]
MPTMEPTATADKKRLDALIEEAKAASTELAKLTEEQVATANRHFELLDYYAEEAMKNWKLTAFQVTYMLTHQWGLVLSRLVSSSI